VVAAHEEPTRPWWRFALHYGVLVIAVCFVAWMIHRFAKMWSAPLTTSALWPPRRGFGWGGFGGVPMGRKRMVLVEAGHRCAIPTCRHPTTKIAHIVPESEDMTTRSRTSSRYARTAKRKKSIGRRSACISAISGS
jgi:hypothetical protein